MLRRLVEKRLEAVGRKRIALIGSQLRDGERTLENTPAELITYPNGFSHGGPPATNSPVILFATDQRFLWAMYDGSGTYQAVPDGTPASLGSVEYGQYQAFTAIESLPSIRSLGPWGGMGLLTLSYDQDLEGGYSLDSGVMTQDALHAVADAFGPTGVSLVEQSRHRSLDPDDPTGPANAWAFVVVGFPNWTDVTARFADVVNRHGSLTDL